MAEWTVKGYSRRLHWLVGLLCFFPPAGLPVRKPSRSSPHPECMQSRRIPQAESKPTASRVEEMVNFPEAESKDFLLLSKKSWILPGHNLRTKIVSYKWIEIRIKLYLLVFNYNYKAKLKLVFYSCFGLYIRVVKFAFFFRHVAHLCNFNYLLEHPLVMSNECSEETS